MLLLTSEIEHGYCHVGKIMSIDVFPSYLKKEKERDSFELGNSRKTLAKDRSAWMGAVKNGLDTFEETLTSNTEEKRRRRKMKQQEEHKDCTFICPTCGKDCHSRIGLSSHSRRCFQRAIPYSYKTDGCQ